MKISQLFAALFLLAAGLTACSAPENEDNSPAIMAEEGVTLFIRFEANDEGLAELKGILNGVSEAMKSEEGFVSAKVHRNIDDPNVFILEEVWTTKELHLEHFDRINQSGDWAHILSLLVVEPQMGYYLANAPEANERAE